MELEDLAERLRQHEQASQSRYESLMERVQTPAAYAAANPKESSMEGINSDKVNINLGEGGGGGGSMAAVIAALGNRNQGNDNAALIAALGNRNDGHRGDDGFGLGGGGGGILGLLAILGLLRGRGGLGGGDDCGGGDEHGRTAILQTLMEGQSDLRAAVPTAALETQAALQQTLTSLALGTQQGFAGVKDSVQNSTFLLTRQLCDVNQNVSAQGCQTREIVQAGTTAVLAAMANQRIEDLQTQLLQERGHRHTADSEFRITQTVTTNQAQAQQQQQQQRFDDERFRNLAVLVANIGNQVQRARSDQDIVNLGTMTASGTQASSATQIR